MQMYQFIPTITYRKRNQTQSSEGLCKACANLAAFCVSSTVRQNYSKTLPLAIDSCAWTSSSSIREGHPHFRLTDVRSMSRLEKRTFWWGCSTMSSPQYKTSWWDKLRPPGYLPWQSRVLYLNKRMSQPCRKPETRLVSSKTWAIPIRDHVTFLFCCIRNLN